MTRRSPPSLLLARQATAIGRLRGAGFCSSKDGYQGQIDSSPQQISLRPASGIPPTRPPAPAAARREPPMMTIRSSKYPTLTVKPSETHPYSIAESGRPHCYVAQSEAEETVPRKYRDIRPALRRVGHRAGGHRASHR